MHLCQKVEQVCRLPILWRTWAPLSTCHTLQVLPWSWSTQSWLIQLWQSAFLSLDQPSWSRAKWIYCRCKVAHYWQSNPNRSLHLQACFSRNCWIRVYFARVCEQIADSVVIASLSDSWSAASLLITCPANFPSPVQWRQIDEDSKQIATEPLERSGTSPLSTQVVPTCLRLGFQRSILLASQLLVLRLFYRDASFSSFKVDSHYLAMIMNFGTLQIGSERCWQIAVCWFAAEVDEPQNQSQSDFLENKMSEPRSQCCSRLVDSILLSGLFGRMRKDYCNRWVW